MTRIWMAVSLVLCLGGSSVLASEPEQLGVFRHWSAWRAGSGDDAVCFMHSTPRRARGKYKSRGDISLDVSRRPAAGVSGEVSVTAGYVYKEKSDVAVQIDSRKFELVTDSDMAFARDSETDAKLVTAMKKGSRLTVIGYSSRGTKTTDTYSLSGFTAAHRAISEACP